MTWDEIKDGVWTLPASRSKTGTEIVRPLSKAALAIIEAQPKIGPCIFGIDGRPLTAFGRPYEILVVDDGSADDSFDILKRLQASDPRLRVIRFPIKPSRRTLIMGIPPATLAS